MGRVGQKSESRTKRLKREQMRLMASPQRMAVMEVLYAHGPMTAAELAKRLGRDPNRLYYHLRKLADAEAIREVDVRKGKRQQESVFGIGEEHFEWSYDPDDEESIRLHEKYTASMRRMTERDVHTALRSRKVVEYGPDRNYHIGRVKFKMTREKLQKLNNLIEQIEDLMRSTRDDHGEDRSAYALTLGLAPLINKEDEAASEDE